MRGGESKGREREGEIGREGRERERESEREPCFGVISYLVCQRCRSELK